MEQGAQAQIGSIYYDSDLVTILEEAFISESSSSEDNFTQESPSIQYNNQGSFCELPSEIFLIRNVDSGEVIDIRDQHKENYAQNLAKLIGGNTNTLMTEIAQQRKVTQKLWEAIMDGDVQLLNTVLNEGVEGKFPNLNSRGLHDWTALHLAANEGNYEIFRIVANSTLLIDLDSKSRIGQTALHIASSHGFVGIMELLIKKGAGVNMCDQNNDTPLHLAALSGVCEAVDILLYSGAEPMQRNNRGQTCLDNVSSYETFKAFAKFCKNQIDIMEMYSRVPFHGVLLRSSRNDHVNRFLDLRSRLSQGQGNLVQILSESKAQSVQIVEEEVLKVVPEDLEGLCVLGKGSFGQVFLVKYLKNKQLYALKVLDKKKVFGSNLIRYAFAERNILQRIKHPFIVKLKSSFQTPTKLGMLMEYCDSGDLAGLLRRKKRLDENLARFYTAEILLAIQELHNHNIIFRDLKPENVILSRDGHARLTDFGLSREGVKYNQVCMSFCGSIAYLAPEMLRRKGHTKAVDWYLLGVVLYEMLVGFPPFYSRDKNRLFDNIQNAKLELPGFISPNAQDLLKNLLQRDPKRRLGYGRNDAEEIKVHSFFNQIDWNKLYNKQYQLPDPAALQKTYIGVSHEEMFGDMISNSDNQLQDWSFLEPNV